eukprot:2264569-Lingulodinium_polyedra.AAC.1
MDDEMRSLVIATAKTVVGMDSNQRRHHGVLSMTALVPEQHPYLSALVETGKQYEVKRKELKEKADREALAALPPVHEQKWVALVLAVKNDTGIPDQQKTKVVAHAQAITEPQQLAGRILTCMTKKAYKQKNWQSDKYRVELMVVP